MGSSQAHDGFSGLVTEALTGSAGPILLNRSVGTTFGNGCTFTDFPMEKRKKKKSILKVL